MLLMMLAEQIERAKPENERIPNITIGAGPQQKGAHTMHQENSRDAYKKLIKTAYRLALNPTLPLKSFKVLVQAQRDCDVRLIEGKI